MDAAATGQITADSFSFLTLFMRADWVVKAVMIGLALGSLMSWAVIVDKLVRFAGLNAYANRFEDQVTSGRALEDVANEAGEHPRHALPRMLQAALREWREARAKGILTGPNMESQTAFLIQRIDRVLGAAIARESQKVEDGLGSLAIVATASPFVGLFGTVWGIMVAFVGIAKTQTTSLAVVAPGIAGALLATAAGLAAAIPAVLIYNFAAKQISKQATKLDDFAAEFIALVSRDMDRRAG